VIPAAICAVVYVVAMATVLQLSLRTYVPGSLNPGDLTLANFIALLKPLYARVFLNTVWICFLTAFGTLIDSLASIFPSRQAFALPVSPLRLKSCH